MPTTKAVNQMDIRRPHAWSVGGLDAAARGDLASAQAHLLAGWEPQFSVDKHGSTALMWAAGGDHVEVVRWLLAQPGVDPDATNKEGRTALMWGCKMAASRAVHLLLAAAADSTLKMASGSTAFDWAVWGGDLSIIQQLSECPDVDIHARNLAGCSCVMWAASAGRLQVLRWLQAHGLDFSLINEHGQGALVKAAWFGHSEACKWLLGCASTGDSDSSPRLLDQLYLGEKKSGLTAAEVTHCAGHFQLGCWLQAQADHNRSNCETGLQQEQLPPAPPGEITLVGCAEERLLRLIWLVLLTQQAEVTTAQPQPLLQIPHHRAAAACGDVQGIWPTALSPAERRWRRQLMHDSRRANDCTTSRSPVLAAWFANDESTPPSESVHDAIAGLLDRIQMPAHQLPAPEHGEHERGELDRDEGLIGRLQEVLVCLRSMAAERPLV